MRCRGITLVELLLAMFVAALMIVATGNAYIVGAKTAKTLGNGRETAARRANLEAQLTDLFNHVYVDTDTTDPNTYFVSGDVISDALTYASSSSTTTTGTTSTTGAAASPTSSSSGSTTSKDSLAFTVLGRRLPSTALTTTDQSSGDGVFEANNGKFGPLGGVTEVELGTTPVGSPPNGATGLFLRQQTPSDSDASQGGDETLLSPDVESISFEFYDGTDWQTTWDTPTMTTRRVPAAVRVTYKFTDETESHIVTFAIPSSDVTPDNPVTETGVTSS